MALSYILKMRRAKSQDMVSVSKEIWDYILFLKIGITAEHLPGAINLEEDWEYRNLKDTSEWILCTEVFKMICQATRTPDIDLFTSRVSHQLP